MALANHGYFGTLDMTANTYIYDYSPYLYAKPKPGGDIKLWPLLRKREDLQDTTCRWYEDTLIPVTVVADGTSGSLDTSGGTTLKLAAGEVARGFITIGTMLRDKALGQDEVVLVTGISGQDLTVVRAYGQKNESNADEHAHAAGATWEIIGHLNPEGSTIGAGEGKNLVERTNQTSILDQVVEMTRSQSRRRMQPTGGDPWDFQVQGNLLKYERILERHVLFSRGTERTSAPILGSMAGVIDIMQDRDGDNISTAPTEFSYEVFDDAVKALWSNGYEDASFVLLVPPSGAQYVPYIHESAMRMPYGSETSRGMKATHLVSTFGHNVPVIPSGTIPGDSALLLNLDLLTVRFMDTMLAYDVPLGTIGTDAQQRRFISEFSLEMHNADTAHYLWQTGLSFVRP